MDDTYFALYIDYFQLKNTKLIEHLNKNQDNCAKKSYGKDKGGRLDESLKYIYENRKDLQGFIILILPLKYLGQNIDFNDSRIFNDCIGHCSLFYNKSKAILGIYDVCVHEHVTKTKQAPKTTFLESILKSQGKVLIDYYTTFTEKIGATFGFYKDNTPVNDTLYSGWGSVLIDTLLNSFIRFPVETIICLTVDVANNDFEGAANLYIKHGFKNPYITNYDFLQFPFDGLLVALSRQNFIDNYPTREERQEVYNNLLYVLDENKKCLEGKDNCGLTFKFNPNVIKTLIRLPYVYYNYNSDGTHNYDNYRGVLKLDKVEVIKEKELQPQVDESNDHEISLVKSMIDELAPDIITEEPDIKWKKFLDFVARNFEDEPGRKVVQITLGNNEKLKKYFEYIKRKTLKEEKEEFIWNVEIDNKLIQNNEGGIISFVSHSYASILRDVRNGFPHGEDYAKLIELYIKFGTICYCVITNEDIFIISFKKTLKNITGDMIPVIINTYTISKTTGDIDIEDYLNKVNSLEIFDCQYFTWEELLSDKITINYPFFNNQCYPNAHVKRLIERLHYGEPNLVK
jgi:hypothetical protein